MLEIFQYSFMIRAFIAGLILGVIAPMIGMYVVARRYSLIADTLAHVSLLGVAISYWLGLPTTALTNGSAVQSGVLPTMPTVQIGGAAATVSFAGVISPGLYQLNVAVPSTVASGDNQLSVSYAGLTSTLGVLLSEQ